MIIGQIDKLLIRVYFKYFVAVLVITMFTLMVGVFYSFMQLIVDKDLSITTYLRILFNFSMVFVPAASSLAVLISLVLSFANLLESLELCAMKSLGVSFGRILCPLSILTLLFGGGVLFCGHYITPKSIQNTEDLLYDLSKMNPSISIRAKEFFNDFPGYSVYVRSNSEGKMNGVIIYNHAQKSKKMDSLIVSDKAYVDVSQDGKSMNITLHNGVNYITNRNDNKVDVNMKFKTQSIRIESTLFSTGNNISGKSSDCMTSGKLIEMITNNKNYAEHHDKYVMDDVRSVFDKHGVDCNMTRAIEIPSFVKSLNDNDPRKDFVRDIKALSKRYGAIINNIWNCQLLNSGYYFEIFKRFNCAISCIIMLFIGVSMGYISKRGSLILPLLIAIVLISIYFASSLVAENMFIRMKCGPIIGGMLGSIMLVPFAIFFCVLAHKNSHVFEDMRLKFF